MTSIETLLKDFHEGDVSLDHFEHLLEGLIHEGSVTPVEIEGALQKALEFGQLSAKAYVLLRSSLNDVTKLTSEQQSASNDKENIGANSQTLRLRTTSQPQQTGTVVYSHKSPSLVRSGSTTALSDETRLPTGGASMESANYPRELISGARKEASESHGETLDVGDVLKDRFVLEQVIGTGGMGVVFKALDLRKQEARDRDPFVALKVLNQDFRENPQAFIALQREAKRAQTLSHPNIINVYDFDRDGPHVYMSMEHLDHQPLSQYIKALPEGGLPFKKAWPIIFGMGSALAYAHEKGIVHSDFKPGNVFIDDCNHVTVLDFGIACAVSRADSSAEEATIFNARSLGALTPAYASLEMFNDGDPDPRDDIYALACVTYELLSGKHPFSKLTAQQALDLSLKPKPIAGLSRRQWRALQHALALRRAERTPSVDRFLKELQRRSALFYGSWAAGIALVSVTASNIYVHLSAPPEPAKVTITLTPEMQSKIRDLLELAEIHFDVGYLTAPTGSNALWAFQQVLKIDPYNEGAIKGIKKIADALEQDAWELYERGERVESMKKIIEGLEADPEHPGLLSLKRKLQS